MLFNFVEHKWWYFLISGLIIVPGTIFLLLGGLKPGIEFRGGSLVDARFTESPPSAEIDELFASLGHEEVVVQRAEGGRIQVRTPTLTTDETIKVEEALEAKYPGNFQPDLLQTSSVSPSFSEEIVRNAIWSIILASGLIVLLIAFAFRSFGWGAFRYGFAAILATLHDALLVLGLFAILGYFFNVEIDSLFVTAVLTVIGFSVHDTIVVFDRIRENLRLNPGEPLNPVINFSIMQTMVRSIITSVTVIFTLLALYSFGGYTIRNFALALLIGIISGTYSSIFNAAQIVSLWQELEDRFRGRGGRPQKGASPA
jgi:preprotein translocase subunit SecF